ncbi:MAG: hypothetical protein H6537_10565 [Bacteroidales bacterium]|nr:hypothetical protein [Bacteroidales bacterium]
MVEIFGSYIYSSSKSLDNTIEDFEKYFREKNIQIQKLNMNEEKKIIKILSQFSMMSKYDKVTLFSSFKLIGCNYETTLILLTFNSHDYTVSRNAPRVIKNVDCELIGLTSIKPDLGNVFIKPETITDKFNELINPVEIDFKEDKEFSSKYYVLADNEQQLRLNIDYRLLEEIKRQNDLYIEIKNRYLIARTLKPVNNDSINVIVELMNGIDKATKS